MPIHTNETKSKLVETKLRSGSLEVREAPYQLMGKGPASVGTEGIQFRAAIRLTCAVVGERVRAGILSGKTSFVS